MKRTENLSKINSTITRERLAELVAFKPLPGTDINSATRDEWMAMAAELQERRNAERDSKPVATLDVQSRRPDGNKFALVFSSAAHKLPDDVYFLYRHAQPAPITADVERDAQRYRFLRDKDAFGDDGEPGLATWDDLIELDTNDFDAAIDARMAHPSVDFLALDNALQKHERRRCKDRNCNKQIFGYSVDGLCEDCYAAISQQPAPVVLDDTKLRELFDSWFASDCSFDLSPEASEADNIAWRESYWYVWQRCRAAMLQACDTVRDLSTPVDPQVAEYEQNVLQAGNSPVTPDGLIAAVNRLLDSDGSRGCYSAIRCGDAHDEIERLLAAAPQEVKGE